MRLRSLALVLILATGGLHAVGAQPVVAWSALCQSTSIPTPNMFLGNGKSGSGLIGVYSEIEFIERSLCLQGPPGTPRWNSWALSWVSLDGPQTNETPGIDIFQGGYAKCPVTSVGSCPYNNGVSYTWYYYAHEQGACGAAFNTGIVKVANVSSGTHFFQVSKVGGQYNFYIDETLKYHRSLADIETCWPGVSGMEWQNEMLNPGDQGGGPLSNHQNFGANQYQNGTGWHPANRTLSAYCDANSYPSAWHCRTSSTDQNLFRSWDDRAP